MIGAWEKITIVIAAVRSLDMTSMAAINQIDDILAEAAVKEAPLYPRPFIMTARVWLVFTLLVLFFGILLGWSARTLTTKDRYMTGLAEQHESTARYYNERTDQIITINQPKGARKP